MLQPLEGLRLLEGRELGALDVLHEGELQKTVVGHVPHDHRHRGQTQGLGRAVPSFSGDDLVTLPLPSHQDGLHHAALADGGHELGQGARGENAAGLERVRVEARGGHVLGAVTGAWRKRARG